ncbi:hypothetical protein LSCM1_05278 [Leishmania martiniquensis]|uniref:Uncharacterized protein n=1 Tax=Leishmania martiniquensis TaxID=1580590 RepID=A0A836KNE3_9TRYP|nr:hypothetical protein LSCM1_05278 [Leishmania martiniquensis]
MTALDEPAFVLRHIHRCGAGESTQLSPQTAASAPGSTAATESSYAAEVLLNVGVLASSAPADSSCAPSQALVCYVCPVYILQAGCPTLREVLADAFKSGSCGIRGVKDEVGAGSAAAAALPLSSPPVAIPLPFLDRDVFQVVALYLEHFYTFDVTIPAGTTETAASPSFASLAASSAQAPSPLRRPLNFQDLYALSKWEHYYVLCQLLGLERSQVDSLRLVECGVWVDLLSGAAAVSLPKREARQQQQQQADVAQGTALSQKRVDCFSLENRRRMWSRLCQVLEAALRLGMTTLRLLCAAVAADMLVDLDEVGLARLTQPIGDGSSTRSIPPFTAEARAQVLDRFPWLKPQ